MIAKVVEYWIASHDNAADMRFCKCGERLLKIGIFARFYDPNLSANSSRGGLDVAPPHICKIDIGIIQVTDSRTSWENLVHKLQTLGFEVSAENGHTGDVAARVIEAGNIAKLYGIAAERNDDRNCFGRSTDPVHYVCTQAVSMVHHFPFFAFLTTTCQFHSWDL